MKIHFFVLFTLLLSNCRVQTPQYQGNELLPPPDDKAFENHWYQGKAEINKYYLEQARYGEIHDGYAVLIFVTEPFLPDEQVKHESGKFEEKDVQVMKLNKVKKFNTGIYRYSMMTSVFTPVKSDSRDRALKVSTSSQEWCGHTYLQLNLRKSDYEVTGHSYFEQEADQNYRITAALTEDELWTLIRVDPSRLPMGDDLQIIPSTMYQRLAHKKSEPVEANTSLKPYKGNDFQGNLMEYKITYPSIERTISVFFQKIFPHRIEGWEETYTSGWGESSKKLTTKAVRTHTLNTDYWNKNSVKDTILRNAIGL